MLSHVFACHAGEYIMFLDYAATKEADYNCNFKKEGKVQSYCYADGNVNALMGECNLNPNCPCDGFVVPQEVNGRSGRLIQIQGRKSLFVKSEGSIVFIKSARNPTFSNPKTLEAVLAGREANGR
jgi:hypothetical protein